MYKLLIVTTVISVVVAEPPISTNSNLDARSIVNKALLNRVADLLEKGGEGSDDGLTSNEGDNLVDTELLERITQIINQNEGSVGKNAPKPLAILGLPGDAYGSPAPSKYSGDQPPPPTLGNSDNIELGKPQVARRIASFDIYDDSESQGFQVPSTNSYSLPNFGFARDSYGSPQSQSSRSFQLGEPEAAERIASFDIEGPSQSYRPPQARSRSYY